MLLKDPPPPLLGLEYELLGRLPKKTLKYLPTSSHLAVYCAFLPGTVEKLATLLWLPFTHARVPSLIER